MIQSTSTPDSQCLIRWPVWPGGMSNRHQIHTYVVAAHSPVLGMMVLSLEKVLLVRPLQSRDCLTLLPGKAITCQKHLIEQECKEPKIQQSLALLNPVHVNSMYTNSRYCCMPMLSTKSYAHDQCLLLRCPFFCFHKGRNDIESDDMDKTQQCSVQEICRGSLQVSFRGGVHGYKAKTSMNLPNLKQRRG